MAIMGALDREEAIMIFKDGATSVGSKLHRHRHWTLPRHDGRTERYGRQPGSGLIMGRLGNLERELSWDEKTRTIKDHDMDLR